MTRKRGTMKKRRQRERQRRRRADEDTASTYWITPSVWNRPCSFCGFRSSIAYRHEDRVSVCELCVERMGIETRESKRSRWEARRREDVRA